MKSEGVEGQEFRLPSGDETTLIGSTVPLLQRSTIRPSGTVDSCRTLPQTCVREKSDSDLSYRRTDRLYNERKNTLWSSVTWTDSVWTQDWVSLLFYVYKTTKCGDSELH